jgi:hypothetical protein
MARSCSENVIGESMEIDSLTGLAGPGMNGGGVTSKTDVVCMSGPSSRSSLKKRRFFGACEVGKSIYRLFNERTKLRTFE